MPSNLWDHHAWDGTRILLSFWLWYNFLVYCLKAAVLQIGLYSHLSHQMKSNLKLAWCSESSPNVEGTDHARTTSRSCCGGYMLCSRSGWLLEIGLFVWWDKMWDCHQHWQKTPECQSAYCMQPPFPVTVVKPWERKYWNGLRYCSISLQLLQKDSCGIDASISCFNCILASSSRNRAIFGAFRSHRTGVDHTRTCTNMHEHVQACKHIHQ